jgi:hypothetical protein
VSFLGCFGLFFLLLRSLFLAASVSFFSPSTLMILNILNENLFLPLVFNICFHACSQVTSGDFTVFPSAVHARASRAIAFGSGEAWRLSKRKTCCDVKPRPRDDDSKVCQQSRGDWVSNKSCSTRGFFRPGCRREREERRRRFFLKRFRAFFFHDLGPFYLKTPRDHVSTSPKAILASIPRWKRALK